MSQTINEMIFAAVHANIAQGRCRIRHGRNIIETAHTGTPDLTREDTDLGQMDGTMQTVRFAAASMPTPAIDAGDLVGVEMADTPGTWNTLRVADKPRLFGGLWMLALESEHK